MGASVSGAKRAHVEGKIAMAARPQVTNKLRIVCRSARERDHPLRRGVMGDVGSVWNGVDPDESSIVAVYGTGVVGFSAAWATAQRRPTG